MVLVCAVSVKIGVSKAALVATRSRDDLVASQRTTVEAW